jgi:hypothetical protein
MVKRSFSPSKIQSINLGGRNYTKWIILNNRW